MQNMMNYPKEGLLTKFGRFLQAGNFNRKKPEMLNKQDKHLLMQIVQEFKNLSAQDLKDWRDALSLAQDPEKPRWYLLQDMYDYLEPDAQLGTSKEIRVATTLSKRFMIRSKKTGVEIPEKTLLLQNKEWFFNFCWHILDTVFYGYTVAQYTGISEKPSFYFAPRRNVCPQKTFLLSEVAGDKGVNYTDPAFANSVIHVWYKQKFGILNDIVPNLIWKKNARQAWAELAEKFGIPPIWATTTKSDEKTIALIEKMLKELGEAATAVLPEGTNVTIQDQAAKNDPYNLYLKQIEIDDKAIAKRLLGGTMITDDGSSKSQSEVHERTLKDVIGLFDKMLLMFIINDQLLPVLAANGFPFGEDDEFVFNESEQLSLIDLWTIVKEAADKYEIDTDWIAKTFNIPITGEKKQAAPEQNFNKPFGNLAALLKGKDILLPNYVSSCKHKHTPVASAFTDSLLSDLSDILINEVFEGADTLATEVMKSVTTYRHLYDGLLSSWSGLAEISYDTPDHHCLSMMEYNLFEFARMKESANVFALNELLHDRENETVKTKEGFRNAALQYLHNPDINWLNTEYAHTVAVGQGASRYQQFKAEEQTVTKYVQIQTVGDEKVRDKHQLLDGRILRLDEEGGITIWTPFDIGCRCDIIQYLGDVKDDALISSSEAYSVIEKSPGDKWTGNRGRTEQVFAKNELYLKTLGFNDDIKKLPFEKYGLKNYAEIKKGYDGINLDESITPVNVHELFKAEPNSDIMLFEDYLKRKIVLKKNVFQEHTQEQRYIEEKRHQLFAKVKETLADADEVYFFQYKEKKFQTRYVKFYNDKVMVVNTSTGKNNLEINTWYEMGGNESGTRKGYLINRKNRK